MKVLIISPGFHPVTGGHGGAVENLINIFLQENEKNYKHDIVVYSAKRGNSFDKEIYKYSKFRSIDIQSKSYRIKHILKNLFRVLTLRKKQRYYINDIINDLKAKKEENYFDKIIFENGDEFVETFKKKFKTKSKIILHLHNDHINVDNKNSARVINAVDEIWTVSNFIKRRIDEVIETNKVKVLYNTIDYKLFEKKITSKEKQDLMSKYKISNNDYVFIYVGRVMDDKGTLELVKAFDLLNKKNKNIKLLIVGGSISLKNTSDYLNLVKNICAHNSNIIFTGQIKNYELYKYYQLANCQIIPSKWNEAFGLIALEGVVSQLQIISSNSGALPEVLGNSCIYVDKNNLIEDLIDAMQVVLLDKTGSKGDYKSIIEKFSKNNYVNTFNKYISK